MQITGIFDPARLRQEYDTYHMAQGGGELSWFDKTRLLNSARMMEFGRTRKMGGASLSEALSEIFSKDFSNEVLSKTETQYPTGNNVA